MQPLENRPGGIWRRAVRRRTSGWHSRAGRRAQRCRSRAGRDGGDGRWYGWLGPVGSGRRRSRLTNRC